VPYASCAGLGAWFFVEDGGGFASLPRLGRGGKADRERAGHMAGRARARAHVGLDRATGLTAVCFCRSQGWAIVVPREMRGPAAAALAGARAPPPATAAAEAAEAR
jgi:hypothetical protein